MTHPLPLSDLTPALSNGEGGRKAGAFFVK